LSYADRGAAWYPPRDHQRSGVGCRHVRYPC